MATNRQLLSQLGLELKESNGMLEASFHLKLGQAKNPLTEQTIERVLFSVMGDRLLLVGPPEFVGGSPINLAFANKSTSIEEILIQKINDHVFQLERRSKELSGLGFSPRVDPPSLQLTCEIVREPIRFIIGCNRSGQFRVLKAFYEDAELSTAAPTSFELSEFRDRKSLEDFLFAMYSDGALTPYMSESTPAPFSMSSVETAIELAAVAKAFDGAKISPRSAVELTCELRVSGKPVRFVASRMSGNVFRGLLAGASGKIWADRIVLSDFPGLKALVASVLDVSPDAVEIVAP